MKSNTQQLQEELKFHMACYQRSKDVIESRGESLMGEIISDHEDAMSAHLQMGQQVTQPLKNSFPDDFDANAIGSLINRR